MRPSKVKNEKDPESPEQERVPSVDSIDRMALESESNISRTSFKRWHRRLQTEHILLKRSSFTLWKCCEKACRPCRWFDSISYDKKICKCCFTVRTFKTFGTIVLVAIFFYVFSYSIFKEQVLPGGTVFFLFVLFITAYITGHIIMLLGLPPMLAHLAIGIIFENLPSHMLPKREHFIVVEVAEISEKILLVIALIRAGLLLDMSRIQRHVGFIFQLALFPFVCEFVMVWITSYVFLHMPWDWCALQGSVMSVVSMASVTSIMQKNKHNNYGEDKDLCTVLIAASVLNVIFGLLFYAIAITYTFAEGGQSQTFWEIMLILLKETALGLSVGGLSGLLVAFFPDKRNSEAPALRILVIAIGSFAIANIFNEFNMIAAAALGCLTLCVIATNMWEELGWHKDHNPVQYFFTMVYYFSQPVVLSLVGYTMNFKESNKGEIGMSICVLLTGLAIREIVTLITTASCKSYPTNYKEKIFILIAWFSKGTSQILLSGAIHSTLIAQKKHFLRITYEEYQKYSRTVKETTVIAILLTTPLACFTLTLLTPVLLNKTEHSVESSTSHVPETYRRRTSIKYIGKYTPAE